MNAVWDATAEELLAIAAPAWGAPARPRLVALALDLAEPGAVLIVGDPLPPSTQRLLEEQFALRHVSSLGEALAAMDVHDWKLVIVSPRVRRGNDGLHFVRAFKASAQLGVADDLRRKYAKVPFLIQPLPGDTQFAVFTTADQWFLTDTGKLSLLDAIRRWCR